MKKSSLVLDFFIGYSWDAIERLGQKGRGEKCQWHFARQSSEGNYVAYREVAGLQNVVAEGESIPPKAQAPQLVWGIFIGCAEWDRTTVQRSVGMNVQWTFMFSFGAPDRVRAAEQKIYLFSGK